MDRELLFKFLRCETTAEQEGRITKWLEADAAHSRELDGMRSVMEGMALSTPAWSMAAAKKRQKVFRMRKFVVRTAAAAAVVAAAITLGFGVATHRQTLVAERLTAIEIPAGNRMSITLDDGTRVWLNSGTKLEYPNSFTRKKRRVKVSGEAMFEVTHDAERPFIVETFACDIEVLGTRFNVSADETTRSFSTALMNGSVKLTGRSAGDAPIVMRPNEKVDLVDGRLTLHRNMNHDEYLWPQGIISIGNMGFEELMAKFELIFDVDIRIRSYRIPDIKYPRGKIRVADGIDHALSILQMTTDFKYEKDTLTGAITIM